ncbi:hypothetical protein JRY29_01805 [Salmonella enterica subsp. enterica serovar Kentucky]|nr:hypothetical protein JRY29_01805 [Salmonella enterica subsp. enterica serovar Kentucky]
MPKTVRAGKILSGGVLKSAMQRLEQGDVVTEAQLARLTRLHSRFMCAGIDASPVKYGIYDRRLVISPSS